MQVSVENTSSLGRRLKIQIPTQEIQTTIREKMQELSHKARVPGFRQGHIPAKELEKRFGAQVRQEAVGKVIELSLPQALEENKLQPAGQPVVEHISNELNKDLEYVVTFEVFPVFKLTDYSDVKVEKYSAEITEADIDNAIEKLRVQLAEWVVVSRPAKDTDRVVVDYTSTMNGKAYENNAGQDIAVEIGSKLFIEGFEEALIGAKAEDKKTMDLTFPSGWRVEKLAGKPVQFNVTVKSVLERKLAAVDENFAKKIAAASSDMADIRAKVRENLSKQVEEIATARLKDQVTDALLRLNPIIVPRALVEREMTALHEDFHRRMGDKPQSACHHQGLMEQAEKRVALGLILNEVIKVENLIADDEQVKLRISSLAKMFGNAEFLESMYYESEELLSGVRHTVLLDQALNFVISKVAIQEKKMSVDELLKRATKQGG